MIQLEPGEKILRQVRRHYLVFAVQSLALVFMAFVPLIFGFVPFAIRALGGTDFSFGAAGFFVAATWWLFTWIAFFVAWTAHYLDVWIVTDRRIVSIEQHGLFNREVSECRLERVQDVAAEVKGFLATILRFGHVHIQTAGETTRFSMENVPDPYDVKDAIFKAAHGAAKD